MHTYYKVISTSSPKARTGKPATKHGYQKIKYVLKKDNLHTQPDNSGPFAAFVILEAANVFKKYMQAIQPDKNYQIWEIAGIETAAPALYRPINKYAKHYFSRYNCPDYTVLLSEFSMLQKIQ